MRAARAGADRAGAAAPKVGADERSPAVSSPRDGGAVACRAEGWATDGARGFTSGYREGEEVRSPSTPQPRQPPL
ncbi:UNVERIFIED_CONTAM: hypothetical protein FKN15_043630 [Acipenser sinensis]